MERTKLNEIFRGDYMAWGLAEFDAEQRGKKAGYCEGLSDGISQGIAQGISQGISQGIAQGISQGISQGEHLKAIETAKNLLAMKISVENISKATGLSLETIENIAKT